MKPSFSQARLLAHVWSRGSALQVAVKGSASPTERVCIREGWLEPLGLYGIWPDGSRYQLHDVSDDGRRALGEYLVAPK